MKEQFLTLKQNLSAARIFLNTFGLVLEDVDFIDKNSKVMIFKDNISVGELHFNDGKTMINANYGNIKLEANYDIPKISGGIDIECGNVPYGSWFTKIYFQVQNKNKFNLDGEFRIDASVDMEFGVNCLCHPIINFEIPNKDKGTLKMQRDGSVFNVNIFSNDYHEEIDIRPWSDMNGYFRHDIKDGKYNEENGYYPYRRYAGVFSGGTTGEYKDNLHVFLNETQYDKELSFLNEFPKKAGNNNSLELFHQKCKLMMELDPSMYDKIRYLRDTLMIEDVYLLDNLISVCFDSYTNKMIEELFGLKRDKMVYQDGEDSLINSYFGIEDKNVFLPEDIYRKLLKK